MAFKNKDIIYIDLTVCFKTSYKLRGQVKYVEYCLEKCLVRKLSKECIWIESHLGIVNSKEFHTLKMFKKKIKGEHISFYLNGKEISNTEVYNRLPLPNSYIFVQED